MAPKRDVPWWTNTVGATSATPFPNVFLHGLATPVLALSASLVLRVAKVSPKPMRRFESSLVVIVMCVFVYIVGDSNGASRVVNQSKQTFFPLGQSGSKPKPIVNWLTRLFPCFSRLRSDLLNIGLALFSLLEINWSSFFLK